MNINTTLRNLFAPGRAAEIEGERNKPLWRRMWKSRTSYIMLLPFLIPFMVFVVFPVIGSAYLSLTSYNGSPTRPPTYVGTDNYANLLSFQFIEQPLLVDEETGEALYNCGRRRVPESELADQTGVCEPAFVRARELLPEGYSEWKQVSVLGRTYLIGARDPRFWTSIINTVTYVAWTVILRLVIGLGLALILRRQSPVNMALRVLFFLPSVTSAIAVTVIWGWIFRGQSFGLINAALLRLGMVDSPIVFLNDAAWTMPVLVLMAVWGGLGYNMILYLAGLQNIPSELYEAAAIDGASSNQQFWRITLPLLRPTTLYVLITSMIGAFQVFEPIYILFANAEGLGGALDSGLTVVPYLYDRGFRLSQFGYASAIAWVLFIIIFAITLINLRVGRANEAY